jgi:glycosyltransferase involved in cell wall biosynthesis
MTKVMVFSDWFAPGYKAGGPIQSLVNLTKNLDQLQFFVVTSDTDHHSTEPYEDVESNSWITFERHIQVMYLTKDQINQGVFKNLLEEIQPSTVYLNSMFSPRFTLTPLMTLRSMDWKGTIAVAPRGMLKESALAEKAWKKKLFLILARWRGYYKMVRWHATNEAEVLEIKKHFGNQVTAVIADNMPAIPQSNAPVSQKKAGELRLICVARISPEKGIEEALRFLMGVDWKGNLHIDFIGAKQNESFLRKCEVLASQLQGAHIQFLGEESPAQLELRWKEYDGMYLPTRGENFGHAIAESLNHGVPVLISNRTPWKNLGQLGVGWDLPLEIEAFQPILKQLAAMDSEEHQQMCVNAWKYACDLHQETDRHQASYELFL